MDKMPACPSEMNKRLGRQRSRPQRALCRTGSRPKRSRASVSLHEGITPFSGSFCATAAVRVRRHWKVAPVEARSGGAEQRGPQAPAARADASKLCQRRQAIGARRDVQALPACRAAGQDADRAGRTVQTAGEQSDQRGVGPASLGRRAHPDLQVRASLGIPDRAADLVASGPGRDARAQVGAALLCFREARPGLSRRRASRAGAAGRTRGSGSARSGRCRCRRDWA